MMKKNISIFVILNVAAISAPIFLAGCGSANPATTAQVIPASNGTSSSSSGSGTSSSSSGSGTSGSNSSGSGTSGSSSSSSGSSASGSSSSGSSAGSGSNSSSGNSGSSGSGSNGSGNSGSGSSGSGSNGSGSSGSGSSSSGSSGSGGAYQVPADALAVSAIQKLSNWEEAFDTGTGSGDSSGEMSIAASPSKNGAARKFVTSYTNSGGERYWVDFGSDTASSNFLYDNWVYISGSASNIGNIEMDMNQVLSNGNTVIYGFQCDGYAKTWDYTENSGSSPKSYKDHWLHSSQACNPRTWAANTWHHVQILYSRDDSGNVTYKSVWLDDKKQDLNVTVPSAFALGWASRLITNFQIDGLGAKGQSTVYVDDMTIYRW